MACELKFIEISLQIALRTPVEIERRIATCTHPDHTWAVIAPGTGTAKAKVEHGKHLAAMDLLSSASVRNDKGMMVSVWPKPVGVDTTALHDEGQEVAS